MFQTIDALWQSTLCDMLIHGSFVESRNGPCLEVLNQQLQLNDIEFSFLTNTRRALSPHYACAELLWYLSGTDDITLIKAYAPQYVNFAEGDIAFGAYGKRIENHNGLFECIRFLKSTPNTRQAVLALWYPQDLAAAIRGDKKDIPCTFSWHFFIRDRKLYMTNTMRSNDMWLGTPYDIFVNTCIMRLIADELGINYGTYTHQVSSLHLYQKNILPAIEAIHASSNPMPHTWTRCSNLRRDITRALEQEELARMQKTSKYHSGTHLLADAATVCSSKWIPCNVIQSKSLKEAINAHH